MQSSEQQRLDLPNCLVSNVTGTKPALGLTACLSQVTVSKTGGRKVQPRKLGRCLWVDTLFPSLQVSLQPSEEVRHRCTGTGFPDHKAGRKLDHFQDCPGQPCATPMSNHRLHGS